MAIGQGLKLYREDIDSARRVRYRLEYIELLSSEDLSVDERERVSGKMKENLEEVIRDNMWLFSEDGQAILLDLMYDLDRVETAASNGEQTAVETHLKSISEKGDSMDGEIAYVTLRGASKRFFGSERPYSDYSDQ